MRDAKADAAQRLFGVQRLCESEEAREDTRKREQDVAECLCKETLLPVAIETNGKLGDVCFLELPECNRHLAVRHFLVRTLRNLRETLELAQ